MTYTPQQAPAGLDTDGLRKFNEEQLREIARAWTEVEASIAALSSSTTAGLALKVAKAGDTMTGLLVLSADPSASLGAATKQYVDNKVPSLSRITASLGADVTLNNVASYFDGPSIAQGATGTWFVSGTVTVQDTAGAAAFRAKLWDGTNVVTSAFTNTSAINFSTTVSLSGYIVSPVGNLRISIRDTSSTSGKILFNASGESKDSTISAIRIA
jgi:hypothetical protein